MRFRSITNPLRNQNGTSHLSLLFWIRISNNQDWYRWLIHSAIEDENEKNTTIVLAILTLRNTKSTHMCVDIVKQNGASMQKYQIPKWCIYTKIPQDCLAEEWNADHPARHFFFLRARFMVNLRSGKFQKVIRCLIADAGSALWRFVTQKFRHQNSSKDSNY